MHYERQDLSSTFASTMNYLGGLETFRITQDRSLTALGGMTHLWKSRITSLVTTSVVSQGAQRCERFCGDARSQYATHTCRSYHSGTGYQLDSVKDDGNKNNLSQGIWHAQYLLSTLLPVEAGKGLRWIMESQRTSGAAFGAEEDLGFPERLVHWKLDWW